jgi:hypothetical protein
LFLAAAFLCAALVGGHPRVASGAGPVADCDPRPTDPARSLVVTDPGVLARFGFQRVMTRILESVDHDPGQHTLDVWRQWMASYAQPACGAADPQGFGLECPRGEAEMGALDPFAPDGDGEMLPIALFNRFDLAPADGSHCGEYRIVFKARRRSFFLIFEGALPNPRPRTGLRACAPVARLWNGLGLPPSPDPGLQLEAFYFDGLVAEDGTRFAPVVSAHSYGLREKPPRHRRPRLVRRPGQIRANSIFTAWNLREFKLHLAPPAAPGSRSRLRVEHVALASNPADELFGGTPGGRRLPGPLRRKVRGASGGRRP